jgi:hypothetical protein
VLPEVLLRAQHTYSETDREQVLALRREGLTFSAISLALNIPPTTCHNWVAAAELRAKSTAAAAAPFWGVNKQAAAQRALSDEEELDLVEAIREWQKDIGGVRWQDIQQLCLQTWPDRGVLFSESWVYKFKQRHNIVGRGVHLHRIPDPTRLFAESVNAFETFFVGVQRRSFGSVINLDELNVQLDPGVAAILTNRGALQIHIGSPERSRQTASVMLCLQWPSQLLTPFIVFKARYTFSHAHQSMVERVPCDDSAHEPARVYFHGSGFASADLFATMLEDLLKTLTPPVAVLMDAASVHLTASVRDLIRRYNAELFRIPAAATFFAQPMDQLNGHFKALVEEALRKSPYNPQNSTPKPTINQLRSDFVRVVEEAAEKMRKTPDLLRWAWRATGWAGLIDADERGVLLSLPGGYDIDTHLIRTGRLGSAAANVLLDRERALIGTQALLGSSHEPRVVAIGSRAVPRPGPLAPDGYFTRLNARAITLAQQNEVVDRKHPGPGAGWAARAGAGMGL